MEMRPITSTDLAACADVFYAAEDELYGRLNQALLPRNPDPLLRLFGHILSTDPERCALIADGRSIIAFGMAVARDELTFLSFLFVRPEAQGRGLGRDLFDRCVLPTGYRGTCVEAIQPVSTSLYGRFGLVPRVPIYTFVGQVRDGLARLPGGHTLEPFAELARSDHAALSGEVDSLDRQVLGISRAQDHRAWLAWGRLGYLLREQSGGAIGYGYVHSSGRVGPLVVAEERLLLPFLGELLGQVSPLDAWQLLVPGPAQETYVALLRAGLRLEGPPALFCATRPGIDHSRYLPASYALP